MKYILKVNISNHWFVSMQSNCLETISNKQWRLQKQGHETKLTRESK